MYVHALHTVHALPDLRVAAGRLRDGVSMRRFAREWPMPSAKLLPVSFPLRLLLRYGLNEFELCVFIGSRGSEQRRWFAYHEQAQN